MAASQTESAPERRAGSLIKRWSHSFLSDRRAVGGIFLVVSIVLLQPCLGGPGVFDPTGSLLTGRSSHRANLLSNGKVLVSGGFNEPNALNSAELYDPATGAWSATGSMANARYEHTATLLSNGKILVTGGIDSNGNVLSSAELYDPASGTWSVTGSLKTGRHQHSASFLPNGLLLVVGGLDSNGAALAGAELYDPATGTWSPTGQLSTPRFQHTATRLGNGQILVAGGQGPSPSGFLASAELYDSVGGNWTTTASLTTERAQHTATLLQSGLVLVAGGINANGLTPTAELYDPATATWSLTATLTQARSHHRANLLSDGTVLVTGGDGISAPLTGAELYDPIDMSWSFAADLGTPRASHSATVLPNGKVLVAGGNNGIDLTSAELFTQSGLPVITSPLSATGNLTLPYSYQFEATSAVTLDVTGLPADLSFDPELQAIVGTASTTGNFPITLSASNTLGTTTATLSLTIDPLPTSGPVVISPTSATGRTGSPFKFQVITSGGSPTTTLTAIGLPPGLTADPATGEISGTVTTDGSFLVTLMVTDGGITNTGTLELTFTSDPARPVITSTNSAFLFPSIPFLYTIDSPTPDTFDPIIYDKMGPLAPGLGLDAITGIISGVPFGFLNRPSIELAGGVVTNVQIFACNAAGCGAQGLFFLEATGAANISTRLSVETDDNVLIGGFITQGNAPAKLVVRGLGPSLPVSPPLLANPYLELHNGASTIASNDDWKVNLGGGSQEVAIENTTLAPTNDLESAILAILDPGAYTAILRGVNNGTGVGLVEIYNLGAASLDVLSEAHLANISTRGFVQTGDNVMIGGFINLGAAPIKAAVRAIGPSLTGLGVTNALADPSLELHMPDGSVITNDNWMDDPTQVADIMTTGLNPSDPAESVILLTLPVLGDTTVGYTAIVRGANNTTGVGLVEAYFGNPCLVNGTTGEMVCP